MITLIDVIFKGKSPDFVFLKDLLLKAREVRINSPEVLSITSYEKLVEVFHSNNYVDLTIITDYLVINESNIPHVFINLIQDGDESELLFYFDLKEFGSDPYERRFEYLEKWATAFASNYGFNYFVCQINHADEKEYYFDSKGRGPLYNTINM
jgi:hypothetical protein